MKIMHYVLYKKAVWLSARRISNRTFWMQSSSDVKTTRDVQLSIREALSSKKEESQKDSEAEFSNPLDYSDDDEANFDERMRLQILRRRKELSDIPSKPKLRKNGT